MTKPLSFDDIVAVCRQQSIELVLHPPPAPYLLALHGEYDFYGDFFTIGFAEVEHIDVSAQFTVGGLAYVTDLSTIGQYASKWAYLAGNYSTPALVMHSAYVDGWNRPSPDEYAIVIANQIDYHAGADWDRVAGERGPRGVTEPAR